MPRKARVQSETEIYHIMVRGIDRQDIFLDDSDREKFLQILCECKKLSGFQLYAYCLMTNHIHLLIKEGEETVSQLMRRLGTRYVQYFNWKYQRTGHLFQDRFKSEVVADDTYFLTVLRYIHQNPKQAGMVQHPAEYDWSSYHDYTHHDGITDVEFGLSLLKANDFEKFVAETNDAKCMDVPERAKRISDDELRDMIAEKFKIRSVQIRELKAKQRAEVLMNIMESEGVSTRQLSRVTGVSNNFIWKLGTKA
jgi:REP element-mobilizing transposase RayT